jgi:hypothetical protein
LYEVFIAHTWDGIRKGIDLYKIPQPTSVDITYEVRLFTNRMKDLNKFNAMLLKCFFELISKSVCIKDL